MGRFRRRPRLLPAALGAVGGLVFVSLFSSFPYTVNAFGVTLSLRIMDHGFTRVVVPPAGQVMARTHWSPLELSITLVSVDIDALRELAGAHEDGGALVQRVRTDLIRAVRHFLIRSVVLAGLGGGLAALVWGYRDGRRALTAALSGLLVYGLLLGATYATYDLNAFRQPAYSGVLKAAPWMVGLVEESILKVEELGRQLATLAGNLVVLFERIDQLEPLGRVEAERMVLIVADIHNNPAAVDFVTQIVESFQPDLVLDAGDLTDFGTAFEARAVAGVTRLAVPYVLAPGNHDSPDLVEQMEAVPNVTVLFMDEIRVLDLRILGVADPSSDSTSPRLPTAEQLAERGQAVRDHVTAAGAPPDILLVHHPQVAETFWGEIPLLVSGHTHTLWMRQRDNSVWLNPGTTGAAGIRGLQTTQEVPYSVILAYLDRRPGGAGAGWRVVAADTIRVFNFQTGFQIERRIFPQPERRAPPDLQVPPGS